MKLIVDKMPETAKDCLFSAMGTGKPRCRHDVKLCPLQRGEECPHLMVAEAPSIDPETLATIFEKRIKISESGAEIETVVGVPVPEPKKPKTKRSTAKKSE